MAQANTARIDGDAFQARHFWRKACLLLDPEGPLVRIGFESGPKGFDDIWVEYAPGRGLVDQFGHPLLRAHTQCKWHVAPGTYGHKELTDPAFINANARSMLQRAFTAQQTHAPHGCGARFQLLTNWRVDLVDPLRDLIHQRSHTLRVDRLFAKTDRSAVGALRRLWCEHLGIDEDMLRLFAPTIALSEATDSLDQMREHLDPLLQLAGLRRIPSHQSAFIYDQVMYQWLAQGRLEFNRASLREACRAEDLLAGNAGGRGVVFGVKSFEHAHDRIEERCTAVLNLLPEFLERQIRPGADWRTTLYPRLKAFLFDAAQTGDRLRLILDAHLTLSFAAGSVVNVKSGRLVEIEQRGIGKAIWAPDDTAPSSSWPKWVFAREQANAGGNDMAVTVSLTHDVRAKAFAFIQETLPAVRMIVAASPTTGPSARVVSCGHHAFDLAEALAAEIKAVRESERLDGRVHLFIAGPGGFVFYLGQHQTVIGPVRLYEFDFEGNTGGSYAPSLDLPVEAAAVP